MTLFDRILAARGLDDETVRQKFLEPDYEERHDPFLLPDMAAAVERLVAAHEKQEHITVYGDYDIDGLTASTVLVDAFGSFGFEHVKVFIPNRFVEGYGMTVDAVEKIAATGATLIVTVDCGSLSEKEIVRAGELGVDVIVTDHHNVAPVQPPAVAVINPKRLLQDYPEAYQGFILKDFASNSSDAVISRQDDFSDNSLSVAELVETQTSSPSQESSEKSSGLYEAPSESDSKSSAAANRQPPPANSQISYSNLYPFLDLPGVGVAFKLVQALQTRLDGLPAGQEKWLLDLVALGTVCDVVTLQDENRLHVYWGLKVLAQTRRPGLKALMAVSKVDPHNLSSRSLGFALGPRMNAAGRLETAQLALDMLLAEESMLAFDKAQVLDEMNARRRSEQDKILKDAIIQAEQRADDNVLVVSAPGWNHGIIGIVAAKLLEKYGKPTFVLEEMPAKHEGVARVDGATATSGGGGAVSNSLRNKPEGLAPPESKGSARSYGDFSAADAIRAADDIIIKGGGHKLAAGVTMETAKIDAFRQRVNQFYEQQKLQPAAQRALLLPREDVLAELHEVTEDIVKQIATLEPFGNGNTAPILKTADLTVKRLRRMGADGQHVKLTLQDSRGAMDFLAFNAPEHFFVDIGEVVTVWYQPDINEWNGRRSVEGRLLHLEIA